MPRYTNKVTGSVISIGDDDVLPGAESDWEAEDGTPKRRRRADTGPVPTQDSK